MAQCRAAQTISFQIARAHACGHAVNFNSVNGLCKLARRLHYVHRGAASPGSLKRQTRRKTGAQNFRSNGTKAYDSGVAGAVKPSRKKSQHPGVLYSNATPRLMTSCAS